MTVNDESRFPHLCARAEALRTENRAYCASEEGSVELFCRDCDFFREDERTLACSALRILRRLLSRGLLRPEDILDAVRD